MKFAFTKSRVAAALVCLALLVAIGISVQRLSGVPLESSSREHAPVDRPEPRSQRDTDRVDLAAAHPQQRAGVEDGRAPGALQLNVTAADTSAVIEGDATVAFWTEGSLFTEPHVRRLRVRDGVAWIDGFATAETLTLASLRVDSRVFVPDDVRVPIVGGRVELSVFEQRSAVFVPCDDDGEPITVFSVHARSVGAGVRINRYRVVPLVADVEDLTECTVLGQGVCVVEQLASGRVPDIDVSVNRDRVSVVPNTGGFEGLEPVESLRAVDWRISLQSDRLEAIGNFSVLIEARDGSFARRWDVPAHSEAVLFRGVPAVPSTVTVQGFPRRAGVRIEHHFHAMEHVDLSQRSGVVETNFVVGESKPLAGLAITIVGPAGGFEGPALPRDAATGRLMGTFATLEPVGDNPLFEAVHRHLARTQLDPIPDSIYRGRFEALAPGRYVLRAEAFDLAMLIDVSELESEHVVQLGAPCRLRVEVRDGLTGEPLNAMVAFSQTPADSEPVELMYGTATAECVAGGLDIDSFAGEATITVFAAGYTAAQVVSRLRYASETIVVELKPLPRFRVRAKVGSETAAIGLDAVVARAHFVEGARRGDFCVLRIDRVALEDRFVVVEGDTDLEGLVELDVAVPRLGVRARFPSTRLSSHEVAVLEQGE